MTIKLYGLGVSRGVAIGKIHVILKLLRSFPRQDRLMI